MIIVLGIPTMGEVRSEVYYSHLCLASSIGRRAQLAIPEVEGLVPYSKARNAIVDAAVEQDADYVMFVDSDIYPPANAFDKLIAEMKDGVVVVGARYVQRGYPFTNVWYRIVDGRSALVDAGIEAMPEEIEYCGMGCTLVDIKWCRAHMDMPLFEEKKDWGEDTWFCRKVRDKGGKVVGVPGVSCDHLMKGWKIGRSNEDLVRTMSAKKEIDNAANG